MKQIWTASCSVADAVERLTSALMQHKFGVLHIHDLKETLNRKGVPFETECRVLEVCNPNQAARVLTEEIDLNMALPCRISVYEKNGVTQIGMLSPKAMLQELSDSESLQEVATEVENVLQAAIEEVTG